MLHAATIIVAALPVQLYFAYVPGVQVFDKCKFYSCKFRITMARRRRARDTQLKKREERHEQRKGRASAEIKPEGQPPPGAITSSWFILPGCGTAEYVHLVGEQAARPSFMHGCYGLAACAMHMAASQAGVEWA